MLRTESYVGPILESYLSRYIKLSAEDLKISLWSGECKLQNLELRLNVIESELNLPFKVLSGKLGELKIKIPWSSLGSQSIIISISGLEIILELKTPKSIEFKTQLPEDSDDEFVDCVEDQYVSSRSESPDHSQIDIQPDQNNAGYLENLITKIKNNIKIEISDFVIKYQEPSFVISTTIENLELTSCDEFWKPAFLDIIKEKEPIVRQVAKISNLRLNIDARDSVTGHVEEVFPDPFLSKTQIEVRVMQWFRTSRSKLPYLVKASLLFEKANIVVADKQLPIAIRFSQLISALYYREFTWEKTDTPSVPEVKSNPGWSSWAMGFFNSEPTGEKSNTNEPTSLILGIYLRKVSIWLKTKNHTHGIKNPFGASFYPVLQFDIEATGIEITWTGDLVFYSCIAGITYIRARYSGGLPDYPLPSNSPSDGITFIEMGTPGRTKTTYHYLSGSLFDYMAPENNDCPVEYFATVEKHKNHWTEDFYRRRFGAFFTDFLYILDLNSVKKC